jgi:hypothetical protein
VSAYSYTLQVGGRRFIQKIGSKLQEYTNDTDLCLTIKVRVKLSLYRPGQALKASGG